MSRRRVPDVLRGRLQCDLEDFVGRYFGSGRSRDAARQLWRLLEDGLGIELSGLHPDDDLASIISSKSAAALDIVEVVIALEDELGVGLVGRDKELGFFRQCVERMAQGSADRS